MVTKTTSVQAGPLGLQGARFATDSNSANLIAHSEFSWNATVDAYSLLVFLDAAAFVDSGTAGQAGPGGHIE